MDKPVTGADVQGMVSHWLQTPVYGYLGSDYGQDLKAILQTPQSAPDVNSVLRKMREDVPVIDVLPADAVSVYAFTAGVDKLGIVVDVNGNKISVT